MIKVKHLSGNLKKAESNIQKLEEEKANLVVRLNTNIIYHIYNQRAAVGFENLTPRANFVETLSLNFNLE